MDIDLKQFADLKKKSAKSFNHQKALIKKLMAGRAIKCEHCNQPLMLVLPGKVDHSQEVTGIRCEQGCTDIALDFT